MPKVIYSPRDGLVIETGSGFVLKDSPLREAQEVITVLSSGTATLKNYGITSITTSGGASGVITLPDGANAGDLKTVVLTSDGGDATLSVSNHITTSPEVFTANAAADCIVFVWNGTKWATVHNHSWTT